MFVIKHGIRLRIGIITNIVFYILNVFGLNSDMSTLTTYGVLS